MRPKPKKKLGQNFLVNSGIREKLVACCDFQAADVVVEIGCGRGEITGLLASKSKRVVALELDRYCLSAARQTLSGFENIELVNQDILKFNFKKKFGKNKVKVFGNIPYYISTPIIQRLIEYRDNISRIFITVQKEFAQRLSAKSGSKIYGSLSCFAQYYFDARILMDIKKGSFYPVPKVDSSLVSLNIREKPAVKVKDEEIFFKLIRTAFNKRRKTLKNSLKELVSKDKLGDFFLKYAIAPDTRPERLSLEDFADLYNCLYE